MIVPKLQIEFKEALPDIPIKEISFYQHQLLVDGMPTETHFDGSHYFWTRTNNDNKEEHGVLNIFSHGLMGNGVLSLDGVNYNFQANATINYVITIEKEKWINFEMGFFADDKGQKHAFGEFIIPNDPEGTEIFNKKTTTVFRIVQDERKEDVLHVHFDVDPLYCSLGYSNWIAGDFNFTLDYSKFMGTIFEYDMSTDDYHGKAHNLLGNYEDTQHLAQLKDTAQTFLANKPQSGPVLKNRLAAFPENMLKAKVLTANIQNSVEDLFTLPVPDMQNLHELSFSKFKALMLYTIDDKWLKWFGEKRPEVGANSPLTQSDADLAKNPDIKAFLKDKFAVGYLTQAFSQSSDEKIKNQFEKVSGYKDKLNYFWKGSADKCFAKYKEYNIVSSALMDSAFVSSVPGMAKYLTDNPTDWAKKLYDYCVTPFTLNGLSLQNTLDGRKRLTHLCTILHSLDPEARIEVEEGKKISYATSLYSRVLDVRLNFIIERFSSDNKDEGIKFLTEFFKQYFNSILAGDEWQDDVLNAAKGDLQNLMNEYKVDNVNALVEKMGSIIADSMEVMIRFKDLPLPARINKWARENPKVSKSLGATMTVAVYGFSIFESIRAFMGWNNLKSQEKSQIIINVVGITANIFNDIVKFTAASKLSSAKASITEILESGTQIRDALQLEKATKIANRLGVSVDVQLADLSAPALGEAGGAAGEALTKAGSLEKAASKWMKYSKVSSAFAKGMIIIALGAACVCTGFQIANDFSTGQPIAIKVLDIIEMVANGIAFLAEAGAGVAALAGAQVCSVVPVIGVIAAVVGIVLAIIALFIDREETPTDEEQFVTDHSISFLNGINSPTTQWLDEQKKIAEHLNSGLARGALAFSV